MLLRRTDDQPVLHPFEGLHDVNARLSVVETAQGSALSLEGSLPSCPLRPHGGSSIDIVPEVGALPGSCHWRSRPHPHPDHSGQKPDGSAVPIAFGDQRNDDEAQGFVPLARALSFVEDLCQRIPRLLRKSLDRSGCDVVGAQPCVNRERFSCH